MSQRILIDTSAYYAFIDKSATDYVRARTTFRRISSD